MPGERKKGVEIRNFILRAVDKSPRNIASLAQEQFGISRQTAHYHLKKLMTGGYVRKTGEGKSISYFLIRNELVDLSLPVSNLEEHVVWDDYISNNLKDLPQNVMHICQYGFTEMLNNAIDHSDSENVRVCLERSSVDVKITISDHGEGIFKRICRFKNFSHEREAIFELSKGKLTTDPERHTGEGIFFSSRMFDLYCIRSGGLFFSHHIDDDSDWLLETSDINGTLVHMTISDNSTTVDQEVFDSFADPGKDPSFHKTVVPIRLAPYKGDGLISRSQAKRILNGFDKFKNVVLDFQDVPSIGQGFADEIFRVFKNLNPEIELTPINACKKVSDMVARVQATGLN